VRKIILVIVMLNLTACASIDAKRTNYNQVSAAINKTLDQAQALTPDAVSAALLPPLLIDVPKPKAPVEDRFTLTFSNVGAQQFFMALVSGTRYSMLVHPEVMGTISANLKDVTIFEALDAIRDIYGYDYRVEGTRISIKPPSMQTRMFQVNYLTGSRKGSSDLRVISGSINDGGGSTGGGSTGGSQGSGGTSGGSQGSSGGSSNLNSSKITMSTNNDFWKELEASLKAIVGEKDGRSVVVSPQSGVVVVRALWDELQSVSAYLKATQLSVDRQVILEAKILEVELSDKSETGINWASFASFRGNTTNRVSAGVVRPGTNLTALPLNGGIPAAISDPVSGLGATTGSALSVAPNSTLGAAGALFGLAFQTNNFASMISFLESQGTVHVLSSPRIATLNNQKAVLKVGTDEFFVTNVMTSSVVAGNTVSSNPTLTVQPFFSGVALDVTPQIDDAGNITLHVHPSVSTVTTVDKPLDLGNAGKYNLPLASSAVSETDSIVRGQDGRIVAIGGLIRQTTTSKNSQMPGAGDLPVFGSLFKNTSKSMQRRELVILIKPTIVQNDKTWSDDILKSQRRMQALESGSTIDW